MSAIPDDVMAFRAGGGRLFRGGLAIAAYPRSARVIMAPAVAYELAGGAPRSQHAIGLVHALIRDHDEVALAMLVTALYQSAAHPSTRHLAGRL